MSLTQAVDIYCERIDASLWSEPINALTNLGFILIGLYLFLRTEDFFEKALCINLVLIGVGSFLFHTFAQRWSGLADVIPIFSFIVLATYGVFSRYWNLTFLWSIISTILVLITTITITRLGVEYVKISLNGSENYLFALLILLISGFSIKFICPHSSTLLLAASCVFMVSLMFRSMDESLCRLIPIGTHFVWHLLNAVTLGLIIIAFNRKRTLDGGV
jgi:hypothetical protein